MLLRVFYDIVFNECPLGRKYTATRARSRNLKWGGGIRGVRGARACIGVLPSVGSRGKAPC